MAAGVAILQTQEYSWWDPISGSERKLGVVTLVNSDLVSTGLGDTGRCNLGKCVEIPIAS